MIPITIITGFLGSGKTTLILNLIPQLPKTYKLALLKNEFGDVAIDSQLASSSAISGVQELLNGCICCNLVGQLSDALETLANDVKPDRIVIETSGSAFPATLAMEVNRLAKETGRYVLDGVMSVIDVENWKGYEDTSVTAKMQARYTDLIVLNKWEMVSERRLEDVEDAILALEVDPPTPRTKSDKGWVDKDIIFGLDAKLAKQTGTESDHHHDHDHQSEVEVLSITLKAPGQGQSRGVDVEKLRMFLEEPTKDAVYRIKGVLYASTPPKSSDASSSSSSLEANTGRSRYILNWAFGRWTYTPVPPSSANSTPAISERATPISSGRATPLPQVEKPELRLTIVTAKYESIVWESRIKNNDFIALEGRDDGVLSVERIL
ncbi:cobalamin synthesis protein/P47K:Cobalamin synthesis protein-like protein/P47K [Westerdykella ornata]|uniref:Cobalamin synthesis protein/P47K:Cobalamin synthesis protein-like protein/P47K n=1 Tax=Westerdykella ornata TaxID=318751 RepID=A0A6A6JWL3_WESOR|nr:cobalamin synthesis protein/P47K:Cobalamin synthesis protein-like protein/P47K [Westerdykella ornata]KAF2281001.1 cobalamin synthesis protein/P47K:Cobalamin synthesis protein-like protein/P47K [Westerdykella ornata]